MAAHGENNSKQSVKLPQINIPEFTGKIEEWIEFFDIFKSLIDENKSIAPIEKFFYLKSSLRGEALFLRWKYQQPITITFTTTQQTCILCHKLHHIGQSDQFLNLNPSSKRYDKAKLHRLCNFCPSPNHTVIVEYVSKSTTLHYI
jgi:hypothetical protein